MSLLCSEDEEFEIALESWVDAWKLETSKREKTRRTQRSGD